MIDNVSWRFRVSVFCVALASLILVACGGSDGAADSSGGEEDDNREVLVFGAFTDSDVDRFEASMAPFEEETGIDVTYEGSADFETLITVRVEGGNPPDIAMFPQPGLMANIAATGDLVDVTEFLDQSYLEQQYSQSWLDLATVPSPDGDIMAGVWYRANVKSLVWYPVPEFEEAGYTVPTTWEEMIAISDEIVADGGTPWCIGLESSGATGWLATDWMEDIMLRTAPPEVYDQWITNEIPFDDPAVVNAAQIMGDIWFNPDYVLGGTDGILVTPIGDSITPMFEDPPACFFHRQASFLPIFFPDDAVIGEDIDYFYLPPFESEDLGRPVLGAGDIASAFNTDPDTLAVLEYLTTGNSIQAWVEAGGSISPHNDAELDWYPETERGYAEILSDATVFRFDASDLMPSEVGAGTFWTAMVDYVSEGDVSAAEDILGEVQATWPEE